MRNLVIAHLATANVHQAFNNAQRYQAFFNAQMDGSHRILITDKPHPYWPSNRQIVSDQLWQNGLHRASTIRNLAIDFASDQKFDWLMIMDADFVLIQKPNIWPDKTGWGQPVSIWDAPHRLTFKPLLSQQALAPYAQEPFAGLRWIESLRPSSCYLLSRPIFSRYRYDESFLGHGFQDNYFHDRLSRDGLPPAFTDCVMVHLWHAKREKNFAVYQANKRRYQQLLGVMSSKHPRHSDFADFNAKALREVSEG